MTDAKHPCPRCSTGLVHLEGWDKDTVVVCGECDFHQLVTDSTRGGD